MKEKLVRILEGILLLNDTNEFELLNLGFKEEEIKICRTVLKNIEFLLNDVTKQLK
ncbi:MAG: hypothetical protein ACFFG0_03310 [Candidatus Thorarchaeota archaeon]